LDGWLLLLVDEDERREELLKFSLSPSIPREEEVVEEGAELLLTVE
jgi:hypothetical protein